MIGMKPSGEPGEIMGSTRPRGRLIEDASARMLNDELYALLLAVPLSPADARRVLEVKRTRQHRTRRYRQLSRHAPEILQRIRQLARGADRHAE